MHAYDALHGDLGAVNREDVVLLFSHSGRTFEVIALLQGVRERGSGTILVTGDSSSPAAALSDVLINTGVTSDEEYLGVVPTTSALVALAFGDALAIAVATIAGTVASEFRINHPANWREEVILPHATQTPRLCGNGGQPCPVY
jgi:arabinose-5-phosphate isomerase